ncbi:MAG: EamA family transporter [Schwartzia sp.]|nr:EamA family transporter [Schwartzia sp. (in: firmicutes)]
MTEHKKGLLMAALGAAMWGGSGVAGQHLLQNCGFTTEWLVVTRMLLAGTLLLLLDVFFCRKNILAVWRDRQDAREMAAFALVGMLAVQYTYFASIKHGNAAAATVLQYLMPIIIVAYTALTARKLPKPVEMLCVALAVLGTFILVTHCDFGKLSIPGIAVLWGLLSAVSAAFYTVQPKRLIRKWRATLVIGWGMLVGGAVLSLFCPPWQFTGIWNGTAALIYAYIILFGTVMAFGCYLGSLKYIQPTEASVLGSIEPLSAILLSVLLLGTPFDVMDALGSALILCTVFLLARKTK